jgi:hypothetical protein
MKEIALIRKGKLVGREGSLEILSELAHMK